MLRKSTKPPLEDVAAAFEAFSLLRGGNPNEATTRVELVDKVLRACGWPAADLEREVGSGAGNFLDYELRPKGQPWMVVEAKRTGVTFDIPVPTGQQTNTILWPIKSLMNRGGKGLREVLNQAATYCNDRGISLACATNGEQWVFFRGLSAKERPWTTGRAFVFGSRQQVLHFFSDFYRCIAREHAETPFLSEQLEEPASSPPPTPRIPADFVELLRPSTPLGSTALESVCSLLLGEITGPDKSEMLEHCYIEPGLTDEFERGVQRLLKDTEQAVDAADANIRGGTPEDFVREVSAREQKDKPSSPVLVVGHVGAGKTTFLYKTLQKFRTTSNAFFAYVDLETEGRAGLGDLEKAERVITGKILDKLGHAAGTCLGRAGASPGEQESSEPRRASTLRSIYWRQLQELRDLGAKVYARAPDEWDKRELAFLEEKQLDTPTLLIDYIRYSRARLKRNDGLRYPVLVVIDNIDQASDEYQRFMYAIAQKISRDTPAIVIIALREDTYQSGRSSNGFLTSSPLQFIFHVARPALGSLLRSRVKFGEHALEHRSLPSRLESDADVVRWTCSLLRSVFLQTKSEALEIVALLSGHNVREALELVRYVSLGARGVRDAPNGSTTFALGALLASRGKEAFRSRLGLGNLFDADPGSPPLHALRVRLLAYFTWAFDQGVDRGALEQAEPAVAQFAAWGYPVAQIRLALHSLESAGLLRRQGNAQESDTRLTISAAGYVHLTRLADQRAYRIAMAIYTRWYENELFRAFVSRCGAAGSADGPTLGDIAESAGAVALFDAYLKQAIERENAILSPEYARHPWVREVLARTELLSRGISSIPVTVNHDEDSRGGIASLFASPEQLRLPFLIADRTDILLLPLRAVAKFDGSVWVARLLWGLEWARLAHKGPITAAELGSILRDRTDLNVPDTNVARAFRQFGNDARFSSLWERAGKRFRITAAGSSVIAALLSTDD